MGMNQQPVSVRLPGLDLNGREPDLNEREPDLNEREPDLNEREPAACEGQAAQAGLE